MAADSTFAETLAEAPLIAILRRPQVDAGHSVTALASGGVRLVEITVDSPGAFDAIAELRRRFAPEIWIGAGTVLNVQAAERAQQAGAQFFVTPNLQPNVIAFAREHAVPIFPGALTPTEICQAHELGATMVKVFPSATVGPDYFREIRGPLPHIPLLAVGGINLANTESFIAAGAVGIGVGGALALRDAGEAEKNRVKEIARSLLIAIRAAQTNARSGH